MTDPVLELRGVHKAFGPVTAVAGIDLVVSAHELVALVGPSGCGKSTLLRVVAGLLPADDGEVRIAGEVVDDGTRSVEPEHRRTGLVFQEHALFPHLTVLGNITFGLRHLPRSDRGERGSHWLDVIGLAGHGHRFPHELSGGERQRVALARALAPEPRLVLLDEPFASLDPNLRVRLRTDIVALLRATDSPALFVTHDQEEALSIGDRVAVMRDGRIEQDAPPDEVYHQPANRFVAGFIDETAFLPVSGGRTELGPLPSEAPGDGLVVLRAQDVLIDWDGQGTDATIVSAEFHGAVRTYTLRLPSGAILLADAPHTTRLTPGDVVRASLRPGHHTVVARPQV
ncbi:MAG: ABC transporter ATP-binding protein [Acidimicrobiales bacterium]